MEPLFLLWYEEEQILWLTYRKTCCIMLKNLIFERRYKMGSVGNTNTENPWNTLSNYAANIKGNPTPEQTAEMMRLREVAVQWDKEHPRNSGEVNTTSAVGALNTAKKRGVFKRRGR